MKEPFVAPDANSRVAVYCRVGTDTRREEFLHRAAEARKKAAAAFKYGGVAITRPSDRKGGGAK